MNYFAHTLEPGRDGEVLIRVTIDRAGEPVTLSIGDSQFSLPPGLAIALGNILISGGKCSIKGKHRQIQRAEDQKASQAPSEQLAFSGLHLDRAHGEG